MSGPNRTRPGFILAGAVSRRAPPPASGRKSQCSDIKRREFIALVVLTALSVGLPHAQPRNPITGITRCCTRARLALADKRPTASTRFRTIQVCPKDLAFGANPVGYAPQIEALRLGLRGFGGFQNEDELAMAMSKGRPSPSNIAGLRADTTADDYPTGKPVRIGFPGPSLSNPFPSTLYQAFLAQLRELGFDEGQNLVAEYQAMDDARGPFVATIELVRSQPQLLVALGPEVALQAPLVQPAAFQSSSSPSTMIRSRGGMCRALPARAVTLSGVFLRQLELAGKQVELLVQAFPDRPRMAVFFDGLSSDQFSAAERTATSLNPNSSRRRPEKIRARRGIRCGRELPTATDGE